jgi:hypothetical protein
LSQKSNVGWYRGTPSQKRQYNIVKECKRFAKAVQAKVKEEKSSEEAFCKWLEGRIISRRARKELACMPSLWTLLGSGSWVVK